MLKKFSIGICLVFAVFIANNVQAQETKIGFVSPQAILNRMPEMKAIQQRLTNFQDREGIKLQNQNAALQQAAQIYEQKKDVISAAANTTELAKLQQMAEDFQKSQEDAKVAIQDKRRELLGPLNQQISEAIDAVAAKMGLSYVLNTVTSTGDLVILYASQEYATKYNITDAVMVELGI